MAPIPFEQFGTPGGGEMTRVTADSDSVSLAASGGSIVSWSPDSEWVAFQSERGGSAGIWANGVFP